jgi:murein DD-endopeptidase MepM/ murein hydrolase activator NlpD
MAHARRRSLAPVLAILLAGSLATLAWSWSTATITSGSRGLGPTPSAPAVIVPDGNDHDRRRASAGRDATASDLRPRGGDAGAADDAEGHEPPRLSTDPYRDLHRRALRVPVEGVAVTQLRRSFDEVRGGDRRHEAIDILAPRHTPVVAVEDGPVAKLFLSKAGGITIYQFDDTGRYCYYYAHLERYADGLDEGAFVRRGQTIGYVGTSGNAPPETPHLHFAIFALDENGRWWEGTPIDPFPVLTGEFE